MKATLTVTRRGVVMLPIEICTDERVAEFDREERALAKPMRARAPKRRRLVIAACGLLAAAAHAQPTPLFEAHSAAPGAKMDISIRETERRPRASVIDIEIRNVGSSVGSSFFLLCSIRKLARLRANTSHVVKLEETPKRGQMLIGFLASAAEPPGNADPAFAAAGAQAQVIELDQFAPICDAKPPAR